MNFLGKEVSKKMFTSFLLRDTISSERKRGKLNMKHQNKIIDYMNENLKGYSFGQLRQAALSRLSYPGAVLSAEDYLEIPMPEDVALYLVNNVLHNLPHNDRLKAKGDAAEADRSGAYSDLESAIAFVSDLYGYFRLSIFERLSFFERYRALEFGESASGEPYVVLDVSRKEILKRCLELAQANATPEYGFTEDEIEVVSDYLLRKMMRLEESGLMDSYCYPRIASFRAKLLRKDREKI